MPVFFISFILFIIWMNVKSKQENKSHSTWNQNYWNREHEANFVRKKDISSLDYIQISEDELPFSETADSEEREYQEQVRLCLSKKMLNLSDMSNTDIKMTYGTANFPLLSVYDQNFAALVRNLNLWGCYLYRHHPEEKDRIRQILTLAIEKGSDITDTYLTLAKIYREEDDLEGIRALIRQVEASDFFLRDSILKKLKDCIRSY